MSLLFSLLVIALIAYLIFRVSGQVPMPQPIRTIVYVILALIVILSLLRLLPGGPVIL